MKKTLFIMAITAVSMPGFAHFGPNCAQIMRAGETECSQFNSLEKSACLDGFMHVYKESCKDTANPSCSAPQISSEDNYCYDSDHYEGKFAKQLLDKCLYGLAAGAELCYKSTKDAIYSKK